MENVFSCRNGYPIMNHFLQRQRWRNGWASLLEPFVSGLSARKFLRSRLAGSGDFARPSSGSGCKTLRVLR